MACRGQTQLSAIAPHLANAGLAGILALVFCLGGIGFKLAAVPFHQWTPDVYEGSPTPVVAFCRWDPKQQALPWPFAFWLPSSQP